MPPVFGSSSVLRHLQPGSRRGAWYEPLSIRISLHFMVFWVASHLVLVSEYGRSLLTSTTALGTRSNAHDDHPPKSIHPMLHIVQHFSAQSVPL